MTEEHPVRGGRGGRAWEHRRRARHSERAWVLGFLDAFGTVESVLETLHTYDRKEVVVAIIAASPTVKLSATSAPHEAVRACSADGELHQDEIVAAHPSSPMLQEGLACSRIHYLGS